ncbi:MAG: methylated-DNA--[protein]-cysteine S-methyltransferase [Proteocatella sp.]
MYYSYLESPIGIIEVVATNEYLKEVNFIKFKKNIEYKSNDITQLVKHELHEYFFNGRREFSVSLKLCGTEFQNRVWEQLLHIPYGTVATYKDIAEKVDCPKGYRAVGSANNKNKLPIIIPCHRVVGSSGKLVGYAGGMEIKKYLIDHEIKNI